MSKREMGNILTRFILEVQKKDRTLYPANSLHHIIAGLQLHLQARGCLVDFFSDKEFTDFKLLLDAEMTRIQGSGVGTKVRKAEIITVEEEELLWEKGILGDKTPQTLLDTIIFLCGLFFALCSGKKHRQLRRNPCQIQLFEPIGERT